MTNKYLYHYRKNNTCSNSNMNSNLIRQQFSIRMSLSTFSNQRTKVLASIHFVCLLCLPFITLSQSNEKSFSKKGYELTLVLHDPTYDPTQQDRLKDVFFKTYPRLAKDFNKKAPKHVTITIDTTYDGVAYAHDGKVVISQAWLEKMPEDIDVVTHEVMHIVQAYPPRSGPGWLVEGIADYVRFKYGVNHEASNWSLPDVQEQHHYTNSYRIAARFLKWVEEDQKKGMVKKLDDALRNKTYSPDIWAEQTTKTLDELWDEYKSHHLNV